MERVAANKPPGVLHGYRRSGVKGERAELSRATGLDGAVNRSMSELELTNSLVDDRFVIERRLSFGSYSEIYLAQDLRGPEGSVIVKALSPKLQGAIDADLEQTLLENFQNEAVALDTVRHPNIIRRLGHGTALDLAGTLFHYLVIEYLPGGDLRQHAPLSFDRAYLYLAQICSALAHAHRCGVIHRDLKPNNLLLTADTMTVKIADFGVAKISPKAGDEITRVGADIYAPPEHHPSSPIDHSSVRGRLTPSADIYSLAKAIYTILTDSAPKQFELRAIDRFPETITDEPWATSLIAMLKRATQERPSDRYQSVEEFWTAFEPLREFTDESTKVATRARSHSMMPPAPPLPDFAGASGSLTGASARVVISLAASQSSLGVSIAQRSQPTKEAPHNGGTAARVEIPLRSRLPAIPVPRAGSEPVTRQPFPAPSALPAPSFWHRLDAHAAAYRNRMLAVLGVFLFFAAVTMVYRYYNPNWTRAGQRVEHAEVIRDVSFRELPTQQSAVIGWIRSGARLRVIERTPDNWVHAEVLDWNGPETASARQGWVYGAFLESVQQ